MSVKFELQENTSGDPSIAAQGFGRVSREQPPHFDPRSGIDDACAFFEQYGYVVLKDCLDAGELTFLNDSCERTQAERPEEWGLGRRKPHHINQGLIYSQPLLDHPALDRFTRHPASYPVVCRLLGGEQAPRYAEFNFRESPAGAGARAMNFHHDAVREDRFTRSPYGPPDFLCAIHYLSDVEVGAPAFCVVPGSRHYPTLRAALDGLGNAYREVPCSAPPEPACSTTPPCSTRGWMATARRCAAPGTSTTPAAAGCAPTPSTCARLPHP
jgi:hypothetical protein